MAAEGRRELNNTNTIRAATKTKISTLTSRNRQHENREEKAAKEKNGQQDNKET